MHLYTIGNISMLEARYVRSSHIVERLHDSHGVSGSCGDERRPVSDCSIIVDGLEELSDDHIRMLVAETRMCRQVLRILEALPVAMELVPQYP